MGLETGTYISDLVNTNPTSTDLVKFGDDHLRLIKSCLLTTFPGITGVVTPTHTELNYVDGVTSAIQTQLDTKHDAVGIGLVEDDATTPSVGKGNGIVVNASDVALGDLGDLTALVIDSLTSAEDGYLVDDNGTPKRMAHSASGIKIVDETETSRTLAAADLQTHIDADNSSAITITLNTGIGAKGNWIEIEQKGAGQVTIAGTATVNSPNGLKTYGQHSTLRLLCKGSNIWTLSGDSDT